MSTPAASSAAPITGAGVPPPRAEASAAAGSALAGLAAVGAATARLNELVKNLDDPAASGASLLPGWSRAHVVSHLARNADALVNLLTWARTGIEHPMYASQADRNADIEEGAGRLAQVLREDLVAACDRFDHAAAGLSTTAWTSEVSVRGHAIPAHRVPWLRLREVWVHLVDLDLGVTFTDIPTEHLATLIDDTVSVYAGRADVPAVVLDLALPGGVSRTWAIQGTGTPAQVSGRAADALGWLTGRTDSSALTGEPPVLPAWT